MITLNLAKFNKADLFKGRRELLGGGGRWSWRHGVAYLFADEGSAASVKVTGCTNIGKTLIRQLDKKWERLRND